MLETRQRAPTVRRVFTYRQINEASNQLAHHFLERGCSVGDVVMIYAYRGCVLLFFFLGVLRGFHVVVFIFVIFIFGVLVVFFIICLQVMLACSRP